MGRGADANTNVVTGAAAAVAADHSVVAATTGTLCSDIVVSAASAGVFHRSSRL